MSGRNRKQINNNRPPPRDEIPFNYAKETHNESYRPEERDARQKYNVNSDTSKQAFAMAKWCNGISNHQQPSEHPTRIPDRQNPGQYCTQYEYTRPDGVQISIRKDNPVVYGNSGGNQTGHYNVGLRGSNMDQHFPFNKDN